MADTVTKANRKLSKESQGYIAERVLAMCKACEELKAFIADEPEEEGEPDDKGAGKPAVGEEVGTDVNKPQPEKQYIEIVEKDSTGSKR